MLLCPGCWGSQEVAGVSLARAVANGTLISEQTLLRGWRSPASEYENASLSPSLFPVPTKGLHPTALLPGVFSPFRDPETTPQSYSGCAGSFFILVVKSWFQLGVTDSCLAHCCCEGWSRERLDGSIVLGKWRVRYPVCVIGPLLLIVLSRWVVCFYPNRGLQGSLALSAPRLNIWGRRDWGHLIGFGVSLHSPKRDGRQSFI